MITELVSAEETGLQVQLAFTHALELEGLLDRIDAHHARLADPTVDDPARPVLLAFSDNGPQMTSGSTREFLAMCAIATLRPPRHTERLHAGIGYVTTTNTRAAAPKSARPAATACAAPADSESTTTAPNARTRHDLAGNSRGQVPCPSYQPHQRSEAGCQGQPDRAEL